MRKLLLICIACISVHSLLAQTGKNYILEIDGDTIHVALGKTTSFKSKKGQLHKVKVSRKEFLHFSNDVLSFDYPSQFSISTTKVDDDTDQLLIMTATGSGLMIQTYKALNPEQIVDRMLSEVTHDDVVAGYKQIISETKKKLANGTELKGKKSILSTHEDRSEFVCLAYGKEKRGVMVMELKNDIDNPEAVKLMEVFWKTLSIKY